MSSSRVSTSGLPPRAGSRHDPAPAACVAVGPNTTHTMSTGSSAGTRCSTRSQRSSCPATAASSQPAQRARRPIGTAPPARRTRKGRQCVPAEGPGRSAGWVGKGPSGPDASSSRGIDRPLPGPGVVPGAAFRQPTGDRPPVEWLPGRGHQTVVETGWAPSSRSSRSNRVCSSGGGSGGHS